MQPITCSCFCMVLMRSCSVCVDTFLYGRAGARGLPMARRGAFSAVAVLVVVGVALMIPTTNFGSQTVPLYIKKIALVYATNAPYCSSIILVNLYIFARFCLKRSGVGGARTLVAI